MLLYGASGHAKVIIDCLRNNNVNDIYLFDDDINKKNLLEYSVIGKYDIDAFSNHKLIISIGDNKIRKLISLNVKHQFSSVMHKSSIISIDSKIGNGTVIMPNSIVQNSVRIGDHCIINSSSCIEHDCIIEDFVHISPSATICGNVHIHEGVHIGAGSVIIPNITIGKWSIIGAGAVIIKNVPDYSMVVGNPGKVIRLTK